MENDEGILIFAGDGEIWIFYDDGRVEVIDANGPSESQ
jgi:hypothetical protein